MRLIPHDHNLGWTPYAWLIYIVPFALTPAMKPHSRPGDWLLYSAATLVFVALYLRGHWARGLELALILVATTAMGVAFWPISFGAAAFFIYAAGHAARLPTPAGAVRAIAAITAVCAIEAAFLRYDWLSTAWPLVFTVLIGWINLHYAQVGRTNARLRLAHAEIEHLAQVAERERIARDLHDLLGHTLSLIILKSELASKLAERDPERARKEITEVERISRDALTQVRAAVRGYRSGGLQAELEATREALASAGVTLEAELEPISLPPSHEVVLSLAMREAVTNIVRHARAKRCRITLRAAGDLLTMTVADDGRGTKAPFGTGLTGMHERLQSLGGKLTRESSGGTVLTMTLPLTFLASPQIRETA
ncbi:MAG TPA: sensor histidine kinase [Thermoanaerobaculia bacterium]|jgi:two-component system sensor histidine kinase DesK